MLLTEHKNIEKYARQCMLCTQNILLPYQYERTNFPCRMWVKVSKTKKKYLTKTQRKKNTFYQSIKKSRRKR